MSNTFGYYVNLDERGEFFADVRNESEHSIFEIRFDPNDPDSSSLIDLGFMKHKKDVIGLELYLKSIEIIQAKDSVLHAVDFESYLAHDDDEDQEDQDEHSEVQCDSPNN